MRLFFEYLHLIVLKFEEEAAPVQKKAENIHRKIKANVLHHFESLHVHPEVNQLVSKHPSVRSRE